LQYAEVLPAKNGQAHPLEDELCGALPSWTSHVGLIPTEHKQDQEDVQFNWDFSLFRTTCEALGLNEQPDASQGVLNVKNLESLA
jgi:hypothetical protein